MKRIPDEVSGSAGPTYRELGALVLEHEFRFA